MSPRIPGTLQAINFHITADTGGGAAASELRVAGPIGNAYIIRQIWINADSGVAPGQFIDVLVSNDGDPTDTTTPTGESIFPLLVNAGGLPAPDAERGIAIPPTLQDLHLAYRVDRANTWIKVRNYFRAPAVALANIHVTVVIERMDGVGMQPPPITPRPPLDDPMAPPSVPTPTTPPSIPPGTPVPPPPSGRFVRLAPASTVAALGLQAKYRGGPLGASPNLNPYTAWLYDPTSAAAAPFRDRITKVLELAGAVDGNAATLVDRELASRV